MKRQDERGRRKKRIWLAVLLIPAVAAAGAACYLGYQFGELPSRTEYDGLPNFRHGKFLNEEPVRLDRGNLAKKPGMFRFLFDSPNGPKRAPEIGKPNLQKQDAVTWLGHSTLLIQLDGVMFLTDPVFGNAGPVPGVVSRLTQSVISPSDLPRLDFVLISHDHYDHLEASTIRHLIKVTDRFIVPLGVDARLRGWGVPAEKITSLNWGDGVTVKGIEITAVTARHFSGRSWYDRDRTLWASYVIAGGTRKIFFGADSGYGRHFKRIGEEYGPFDLAMLEIDAWNERWPNNHMFPDESVKAARELNASVMMPIHWGVFDLAMHPYGESLKSVRHFARLRRMPLLIPKLGGTEKLPSIPEETK